jgi:hypothetical protein
MPKVPRIAGYFENVVWIQPIVDCEGRRRTFARSGCRAANDWMDRSRLPTRTCKQHVQKRATFYGPPPGGRIPTGASTIRSVATLGDVPANGVRCADRFSSAFDGASECEQPSADFFEAISYSSPFANGGGAFRTSHSLFVLHHTRDHSASTALPKQRRPRTTHPTVLRANP